MTGSTETQLNRQTVSQTDSHDRGTDTDRQENAHKDRHTRHPRQSQIHRQTGGQTVRRTDAQIARETFKTVIDTQTNRQTARQESRHR